MWLFHRHIKNHLNLDGHYNVDVGMPFFLIKLYSVSNFTATYTQHELFVIIGLYKNNNDVCFRSIGL